VVLLCWDHTLPALPHAPHSFDSALWNLYRKLYRETADELFAVPVVIDTIHYKRHHLKKLQLDDIKKI